MSGLAQGVAELTVDSRKVGAMAAQGGGEFSDYEIGRAIVYMANQAGGKLAGGARRHRLECRAKAHLR